MRVAQVKILDGDDGPGGDRGADEQEEHANADGARVEDDVEVIEACCAKRRAVGQKGAEGHVRGSLEYGDAQFRLEQAKSEGRQQGRAWGDSIRARGDSEQSTDK